MPGILALNTPPALAHQAEAEGSSTIENDGLPQQESSAAGFEGQASDLSALSEVDFNAASTNSVSVTGYVGQDPRLGETTKGLAVVNLFVYVFQGKQSDSARYARLGGQDAIRTALSGGHRSRLHWSM